MTIATSILGILALVIICFPFATYNNLIRKRNQVNNVDSTIDVILKKRHDLIPNLISCVKAYMKYETDLLEKIIKLRSQALNTPDHDEKLVVENQLSSALGSLKVQVEQYPDLKASQNFLQLQTSINEVEEQLSAARRAFNSAITEYNNLVQMFPSSIIASLIGFREKVWFEIPEGEKANISISEHFEV